MKRTLLLILAVIILAAGIGLYFFLQETSEQQAKTKSDISVILNVIFILTIISLIYTIIRDNNDPTFTVAWLQILIFLPVVGFFLYIFFGINYRKRKMFRNKASLDLDMMRQFSKIINKNRDKTTINFRISSLANAHIIKLLYRNNLTYLTLNNSIESYIDGKSTIEAIFNELKLAQHHIHLEYFSINNDACGMELQKILIDKANQGVEVRLIYDAVGCWKLRKSYLQPLQESGVQVIPFLPVFIPFLSSKLNFRNHRKIAIIDGLTGFVGGVNFGDKYLGTDKRFGYWRDSHIRLQGDSVYSLQKSFLIDWDYLWDEKMDLENYFPEHQVRNNLPIQFASSGPDSQWENILQVYFAAITQAKYQVLITSPYLVLNESMLTALKTAASSGVDVRIILPQKADHLIVFLGTRSYYQEMLDAGVKLFQYNKGFVHAKVLLVDDQFVSVGSANMDIRSFKQNFEINAIIYDKDYSVEMKKQFERDISDSIRVNPEEFAKRNFITKSGESVSRLVSPLL